MYVILTYDIEVERLQKVYSIVKKYLLWSQNSVFEGKIGKRDLDELITILESTIDKSKDSIRLYISNYEPKQAIILGRPKKTDVVI